MNINELVIIAFEKARQNVQSNKPNVLVTLIMITHHFAKKEGEININRVRNFVRHFETYILYGKNSKLYQGSIDFYNKYLEVKNQKEFKIKYASEIQNITQITENLKKLNEKNPVQDFPIFLEKPENSEIFTEKYRQKKKEFRKETLIGVVLFAVLGLLLLWYRKPQPFINIENFNIGTQYYYATDKKGNYIIGAYDELQNAKPLTPQVFNAYFQQQGFDTIQPEVKFIKAQYFNNNSKITDNQTFISTKQPNVITTSLYQNIISGAGTGNVGSRKKGGTGNHIGKYDTATTNENFNTYLNTSITHSPNKINIAVLIVDEKGNIALSLSSEIANIYNHAGNRGNTGLFKNSFVHNSGFQELYDGNSDIIETLKLNQYTDYIAIGKVKYSVRKGTLVNETFVCTASLNISIISVHQKTLIKNFTLLENANDITESLALEAANTKLLSKYSNKHISLKSN